MSAYRVKSTFVRTTLVVGLVAGLAATLQGCVLAVGAAAVWRAAMVARAQEAYGGFQMPDIVANLRVDQAWGYAQLAGAITQNSVASAGPAVAANGILGAPANNLVGWFEGRCHRDLDEALTL